MPSTDVLLAWHRLRNALGAAGMGTWHVDLHTDIATHDESLNRILGLEASETQGPIRDPAFTRIHPDDHPRVMFFPSSPKTATDYKTLSQERERRTAPLMIPTIE